MIQATQIQGNAIKDVVAWYGQKGRQIFYLAGYAGVGKSTIATIAIEEIRAKYKIKNVCIAAYTGKAASVLRRKGIEDATTIHNMMYRAKTDKNTGELKGFRVSRSSAAADADLIVLDECSMIDDKMAADLISFEKKILVMGDPGQLPPVKGVGAFVRQEPDVFLTEIHRQAADSPILELATMARQGINLPMGYDKNNVRVLPLNKQNGELIHNSATQVICGLNSVRWTITGRIRNALMHTSELPAIGERLMCCKNNHAEGIFNGMMGRLTNIENNNIRMPGCVTIDFHLDDEEDISKNLITDPYLFANHKAFGKANKVLWEKGNPFLNEFDFAYAITCHKSQGSQYPHVTIVDDSASFRLDQNKWLYTAITRAETGLTILRRE